MEKETNSDLVFRLSLTLVQGTQTLWSFHALQRHSAELLVVVLLSSAFLANSQT